MGYKIFWTEEALDNLDEIISYLEDRWSQKEVDGFKKKLTKQLQLIQRFPKMFPVSGYNPELRKAVLSKQTTIYYKVKDNLIYLVFLFVNYQDINKIK